ncbi:long-chain fatty acid-CoA ligase [Salix suchowensis]|nr:long-chain fatty acid-CoA ligase [Salix suchowensis]
MLHPKPRRARPRRTLRWATMSARPTKGMPSRCVAWMIPLNSLTAKIVEFYFADSNLPYDRFMWTLHTKNPEHWVPISTVASFKRMREHTARGLDWVVKAVRLSEELELDAEGVNVRRTTEVQEPKDQFERSVYAVSRSGSRNWWEKLSCIHRKALGMKTASFKESLKRSSKIWEDERCTHETGREEGFQGLCFREFTDFKSVDAFLNAEPKPTWEGKELLIMSKRITNQKEGQQRRRRYSLSYGKKIRVQQDKEGNGTVKEEDVPFVSGASLKFEGCDGQVDFQHIKRKKTRRCKLRGHSLPPEVSLHMPKTAKAEGAEAGEVVVAAVGKRKRWERWSSGGGRGGSRNRERAAGESRQKRRNMQVTSENGPWSQMVARMLAFAVPRPLHPYNLLRRQRSTTTLLHSLGRDEIKRHLEPGC